MLIDVSYKSPKILCVYSRTFIDSMAHAASSTMNASQMVEWIWKSNPNPFDKTQQAEWKHYSDVESCIIEKAWAAGQTQVIIDDYIIDFETGRQTSRTDSYKQRPVKRFIRNRNEKRIRESRFTDLPVSVGKSSGGQYGWISPFIVEVRRRFKLGDAKLPSKNPELIPGLVEKAAQGIIEEGQKIGKVKEAEGMANMLREHMNSSMKEVWKCCVHLYTLQSFLYPLLNATLRLIGSKDNEAEWQNKITTLGPFCLLLWDDPFNTKLVKDKTLYRVADLLPEHIDEYRQMAGIEDEYRSFQSFVSTSRNRAAAEIFKGNTLFIMKVCRAFVADVSQLSEYEIEEEELITPGVCFCVKSVEPGKASGKHIIRLELKQRFNGKCERIHFFRFTDRKHTDRRRQRDKFANAIFKKSPRRHG
jgi:hypothetical protein